MYTHIYICIQRVRKRESERERLCNVESYTAARTDV